MTKEKVLEVIERYRVLFRSLSAPEKRSDPAVHIPDKEKALAHLHQMLDTMVEFLEHDKLGKAFRWLGFIQGALWVLQIHTLDELKDHSRPDLELEQEVAQ